MKKEYATVMYFGHVFIPGVSKTFDRDLEKVVFILAKDELAAADRFQLLNIYKAAYHESGKIESIWSYDASATNCTYCKAMRKKAENNPAHICNFCYDYSNEQYRIQSLNRHSLNMMIMSKVDFTIDELQTLPGGMINRINSAGDIPNKTYARNMIKIAMSHSFGRFAFWTKNDKVLIAATRELGKPVNAVYIKSSETIGRPAALPEFFDYVFTVYPDKKTTEKAIADGSAECNGKKCKECGFKCYYGTHKSNNIAELLRGVNKEKRAAIIGWLAENK